jgi:hypothetical protein
MADSDNTQDNTLDSVPGFDEVVDFDIPGFDNPPAQKTEETQDAASAEEVATEAEEAPAATAEEQKAAAVAAEQKRMLKFLAGEKAVDLEEDAKVEWKIDGKPTPVTVRELLDNYAGKVAYEKRFQQVANDRKALDLDKRSFSTSQERQKQLVLDMYEKTKAGKTFEAVQSMIEMTGLQVDARQYVKALRDSLIEQARQMAEWSPEQREVFEHKEERDYLAAKYEKLNQLRQREEADRALQSRMTTVAEQNGIPYDEFAQTHEWLRQQVQAHGGDLSRVTPEYVVEYRRDLKAYETARDAIAAVSPELIRDNLVTDEKQWDRLAQLAKAHKDIDPQEFVELYRQSRKKQDAKDAGKKLEKAPVNTPAKASIRKPKDPDADAFDFTKISKDDARW